MYQRSIAVVILFSLVWAGSVHGKANHLSSQPPSKKVIELEGPSSTPAALYVQDVLKRVYDNIGYQIKYRQVPLGRSFIEANKGELDGLRARVGTVADKYPNLIKVPFEILDFSLVLLADRRVCGVCDLSSINRLAVTRGIVALEGRLAEQLASKALVEVTSSTQNLELLVAGKVQAAIMSDTNVPPEYYALNHHWMKRTLTVLPDYHYLHKKHRRLVPLLYAELETLQANGTIAALRKNYGLRPVLSTLDNMVLEEVKIVSESWREFTDKEDATYWRIMSDVYKGAVHDVSFETHNWQQAKNALINGDADILVGAYSHELPEGFIKSDMHLDYDLPVRAYGKNKQALSELLKGTQSFSVCFKPGYSFKTWLPASAEIETMDIDLCRQKLLSGTVDMVLDYELSWPENLSDEVKSVELMEGRPLFLFFRDSTHGLKLKSVFDQQYPKLALSGKLAQYFPNTFFYKNANLVPSD